jgi:hypothetical protein
MSLDFRLLEPLDTKHESQRTTIGSKPYLSTLKHWNDFNTSTYRNYKYGFPSTYTWETFFTLVKLDKIYYGRLVKSIDKLLTEPNIPDRLIVKVKENLEADGKHGITTSANYLCQLDVWDEKYTMYFCDWHHFQLMFKYSPFLFDSEDTLSLAYIFTTCLRRHISNTYVTPRYCPNPCFTRKIDNPLTNVTLSLNPCSTRTNTLDSICVNANENLLLYENNFKCNCKRFYEWDGDFLECRLINPCNREDDPWCGGYQRSSHCEFVETQADMKAIGYYEFNIECTCAIGWMGTRCDRKRDACIENFDQNLPSGLVACGQHGICIPNNGTNEYRCECFESWTDDLKTEFPDCNAAVDPCGAFKCQNGYCKMSPNKKQAVCICDNGFKGKYCDELLDRWLVWGQWTTCYPKCGLKRERKRERVCSNVTDITRCMHDSSIETMRCEPHLCMKESNWQEWSSWLDCSDDCENNTQIRTRFCSSDAYKDTHTVQTDCFGPRIEFQNCNIGQTCDFVSQASIAFFVCICFICKIAFSKIKKYFDKKKNKA